ncbi:hypothetical protein HG536_0D05490 [Torulaspora globosa]|uniref:Sm protein B n=1 Tax=Torulaspora globosa TaxID=48254 RepID=A0A7G3ZHP2_9SACH|nr:uncharacterized protein HG536_0D05490 [Torulaspora globosa]QLL33028.1 hypothetical protein HG536_0D05490 [Torulaspora globosa]
MAMASFSVKQNSRLSNLVGYRLRIISQDGRVYIGELMAFDKHMNVVLKNCTEERVPRTQIDKLRRDLTDTAVKVEKRVLGLTILRGEQILSTVVEDKPALTKKERLAGVEKQQKKIQKQRRQRSKNKSSGVNKPPSNRYATGTNGLPHDALPQKRKFQPPPGFKKRQDVGR